MKVTRLPMDGPLLIEPAVFYDDRGYFFESYNATILEQYGVSHEFVQDNQSFSMPGVLRGLHFQNPPFEQGKLIRVVNGSVLDVIVDIRKKSTTYGQNISLVLDDKNRQMMWIPPGFAHGFISLQEETVFLYKCTNVYNKQSEGGIIWNDPDLGIDWRNANPIISTKDLELGLFKDLDSQF